MKLAISLNIQIEVTDAQNEKLEQGDPESHESLRLAILDSLRPLNCDHVELLDMGPYNVTLNT
jgi:hypothetical protein